MSVLEETTTGPAANLAGLRGWLILVGFGFCLAPFRILKGVAEQVKALDADTWVMLTTPGGAAYHPLWAPLLLGEVILNLGLLGLSILAVSLFFKKRRAFPRVAIAFLAAGVSVLVLDLLAVRMIPMAAAQPDASDLRDLFQAGIGAAIWIPYFLQSKRVRATFVQ
jgi:hypothetical protein